MTQQPLIPKYPKRVDKPQWECSDGRVFGEEKLAKEWEELIPLRDLIYSESSDIEINQAEQVARLLLTKFAILPRSAS